MRVDDQRVTVERLQFVVSEAFCNRHLENMGATAEVRTYLDQRMDAMVVQMTASVAALPGKVQRVQYPASWWDHVKHDLRDWLRAKCSTFDQYGLEEYGPEVARRVRIWVWLFKQESKLMAPPKYTTKEVKQYLSVCPHLTLRPDQSDCTYALHTLDNAFHNADEPVL